MNLLGLIDLALIATNLKITKSVDEAMRNCEDAIANLKLVNKTTLKNVPVGIASQNLIEELLESLM